ncbi:hypothetical protein [Fibrobacter sp. UWR2]|uniref:hypothetical protein n=1 Tax=Fibrobacter sp. UWR2 TaxID=1964352 RepID=UPI00118441E6|nr:hypothetical protein [Fibrobacter sp. UWR2]
MGFLGKALAFVLFAAGVSSAQLLSLLLFLIPEKTLDEKFEDVRPPADTLTDAQIEAMPLVDLAYDSSQIYKKLIVEENERADVSVFPSIVLGTMDAIWLFFLFAAVAAEEDDPGSVAEGVGKAFSVPLLYLMGVTGLVVTTPFFIYQVYKVSTRGLHARRRDDYYRSYVAYEKRRARSKWGPPRAEVYVAPIIDVANVGAGVNVLVTF